MKRIIYITIVCVFLSSLYSCKPNLEGFIPTAGEADFSNYVAIGNSLTAGYADGALTREGQTNSFSQMLATQFSVVGGGEFKVPFLPEGTAGNDGSGGTRSVLRNVMNCQGFSNVGPVTVLGPAVSLASVSGQGPFNALGIPGARAVDAVTDIYSSLNPFLGRIAQIPGGTSILKEALRAKPTFFSLWLGSNDVLGFATGGGVGAVDPAFPFPGDLTNPAQLGAVLTATVDSLVNKAGAQGVIANIPDVTSVPFFTTIPWNGVVLTQGAADTLNLLYTQVGHPNIRWKAGANPYIIEDTTVINGTLRIRQARPNELILLTTPGDSIRCAQWGISPFKALGDVYVLDDKELADIQAHTNAYNTIISNIASTYDIALADMNSYMKEFNKGIVYNGANFSRDYISGGVFSLDAVHPNPRGYALVANRFIEAINRKYKATVPTVDVNSFEGVIFP